MWDRSKQNYWIFMGRVTEKKWKVLDYKVDRTVAEVWDSALVQKICFASNDNDLIQLLEDNNLIV